MKDLIFEHNEELWAIHHGAVYSWHGTKAKGYVSNIPRAFVSPKGLKAYGGGRALTDSEHKAFTKAIETWKEGAL